VQNNLFGKDQNLLVNSNLRLRDGRSTGCDSAYTK